MCLQGTNRNRNQTNNCDTKPNLINAVCDVFFRNECNCSCQDFVHLVDTLNIGGGAHRPVRLEPYRNRTLLGSALSEFRL